MPNYMGFNVFLRVLVGEDGFFGGGTGGRSSAFQGPESLLLGMKRRGQSEYALEYEVKDPEQEDDNRDLVDTVHHSDINVGRPGRVFLSEKIATHLTE